MTDARQFNIRAADGRLLCPACGFPGFSSEPAYDERGGIIGTGICPCCLWEPGFDDDPAACATAQATILASLRAYRARWGGEPRWTGPAEGKPSAWNGQAQLRELFAIAPQVR